MDTLIGDMRGLVDQLNPISRQNQILYFFWLFGYFFLMAGIWRCERRSIRFCFLVIHQLFSAGVFISKINIVVLVIYLWLESLGIVVVASGLAMLIFRHRRPRTPPDEAHKQDTIEAAPTPDAIEAQAEQLTAEWRAKQTPADEVNR